MSGPTLYIARHGETDWNRDRRIQGSTDISLNETGREQARGLSERLSDVPFSHLYVSAMRRALETAAAFPSTLARTVLVELNERHMGSFEGTSFRTASPEVLAAYQTRKFALDDDLGGGESLLTHRDRARRALARILGAHPEGNVLVVAHGATNAMLLTELHGRNPESIRDFRIENADVFKVRLGAGRVLEAERLEAPQATARASNR